MIGIILGYTSYITIKGWGVHLNYKSNINRSVRLLQDLGRGHVGIVLNYCQYGVLYLGSYYNTGPYINFPHFGNSNLGKLPCSIDPAFCHGSTRRLYVEQQGWLQDQGQCRQQPAIEPRCSGAAGQAYQPRPHRLYMNYIGLYRDYIGVI